MIFKKRSLLLLFFIIGKIVLQFFAIDSGYELHRDEFLHLDLGWHLAWGYASVPPITGLISFFIQLLGNTVFWIKFFPALFGAAIIFFVWKTIEELNGGIFALVVGSLGVLLSVLVRINTLYQPNSLDFLMWTLLLYVFLKYLKTGEYKWLYACSIVFAFGFLNKYNIGFLLLALALSVIVTKKRILFLNKHLYFSAALAFLIILPNMIWQVRNGFPVFHHLQQLAQTQLINVKRTDFLIEQFYFFSGSGAVIIVGLVSFFTNPPFKKYSALFFTFLFTLVVFVFLRAKSYYSIGLYPVYLAFGAVYLEKLLSSGWTKYLRVFFLIIPVVTFILMFRLLLPVLSPEEIIERKDLFEKYNLTRWEDGKIHAIPQDYADMTGWKELAHIVDSAILLIEEKDQTLVQCDNYGQAGAINFYSNELVTEALSMGGDYINWYPLDQMEINNVVLVKGVSDTDKNRDNEAPFFDEVVFIDEIKTEYAREKGTRVYLLKGARQSINEILKNEIEERWIHR